MPRPVSAAGRACPTPTIRSVVFLGLLLSRKSMPILPPPRRIVIMGAAGRDFHNFNMVYRDDPATRVVAFTATQIPGIAERRYPAELAGPLYPQGIPIVAEAELPALLGREGIGQVIFAYRDIEQSRAMHAARRGGAAPRAPFWRPHAARWKSARNTSRISRWAMWCMRAWTMRASW